MATQVKVRKCQICNVRPASTEQGYCHNCQSQLEADKRRKRPQQPFRYVTHRGITIGFHNVKDGKLRTELITRDPEKLPQAKLINLDRYCPGYTRQQVKKLKRLCLRFAK